METTVDVRDPPRPPPPPIKPKPDLDKLSRWSYASASSEANPSSASINSSYSGSEPPASPGLSYAETNGPMAGGFSPGSVSRLPKSISPGQSMQENAQKSPHSLYSLPGVLHYLQHEWTRFELDRAQWEVEKAELQAKVAFLQGERKSQENLKVDLVRRIKMLELALRQERQNFASYKREKEGGARADLSTFDQERKVETVDLAHGEFPRDNGPKAENLVTGISWKEGRHLLRQYLKEIGYTDSLITARQARVRTVLGAAGRHINTPAAENNKRDAPQDAGRSVMDSVVLAAENAICATFELGNTDRPPSEEEDSEEDEQQSGSFSTFQRGKKNRRTVIPRQPPKSESNEGLAAETDTEAAMKEFDFLPGDEGAGEARPLDEWNEGLGGYEELRNHVKDRRGGHRPKRSQLQEMLNNLKQEEDITDLTSKQPNMYFESFSDPDQTFGGESAADGSLALGELAALSINNDLEGTTVEPLSPGSRDGNTRRSWNTKYTLRSHFDGIRSLVFHPEELMLMTASEDGTLKYWNLLRGWNGNKKNVDFEPVQTFRGHHGPVLSCAMSHNGEYCYSGGADGTIRLWNLTCVAGDPYDAYDPGIVGPVLSQHTDAVWHLKHHPSQPFMLSCGADELLMLWDTEKMELKAKIGASDWGAPTSADVFPADTGKVTVSYRNHSAVFDVETGTPVVKFRAPDCGQEDFVYRVVNHPSLPLAITAHEDRQVRFFDTKSGEMVSSMVAHLDAVSCLAVDPNGLYLITGSHDSSVRFWSMDTKTCIQENTAHRKKFEESIHDIVFHPTKNHVASAGADGIAKVYA